MPTLQKIQRFSINYSGHSQYHCNNDIQDIGIYGVGPSQITEIITFIRMISKNNYLRICRPGNMRIYGVATYGVRPRQLTEIIIFKDIQA